MTGLHQELVKRVDGWRRDGYPSPGHSAIAEILGWSVDAETGALRYLRRPQLAALETYWYLRIVEETPHVYDLYRRLYPTTTALLGALGFGEGSPFRNLVLDAVGIDAAMERVKTDDDLVDRLGLEALRETVALRYPSYILALAMGAGKTVLIGAIIATEFAMAMEYPEGPFVRNALVFVPGKTPIGSLRELADIPYDRVLPGRLHKRFAASVKLVFTRDGERTIPVIPGSSFNVVVTNTEKIRIQKETIPRSYLGNLNLYQREDEARGDVANLRLQAIAALPSLAVFSDEAHHTYGQSLDTGLKKVRKTVDYLAGATNVRVVVNTTGTPYFRRQVLRDVVFWYGLAQGIRDGYLKDVSGNIRGLDVERDAAAFADHVVRDFFAEYGDVRLPNGSPAKLAMYFPQTDDLRDLRPVVDRALLAAGQNPAVCIVNTSDEKQTTRADEAAFDRLNHPGSPHRVALLVNRGSEGWNCPSLFACALVRTLRSSNNFVLQAATRCLRQVPGNPNKARIYLSADNRRILDHQLAETYGETLRDLDRSAQQTVPTIILLRKADIPPLVITQEIRTVVAGRQIDGDIRLARPAEPWTTGLDVRSYTLGEARVAYSALQPVGDAITVDVAPRTLDVYAAAVELAARYRLDVWGVYDELRRLYPENEVPETHLEPLAVQIEKQTRVYEVRTERVERALALVRPEGFKKEIAPDGSVTYTAEIRYSRDREHLLARLADWQDAAGRFGFHYDPYNFDSKPEMSFFDELLRELRLHPDEVEDIYFTGALTDPGRTDFFVEYRDEQRRWRRYTPDFVIRRKPAAGQPAGSGRAYIVEVKREHDRAHPVEGEHGRKAMAIRAWTKLDPERLRYEILFTDSDAIPPDRLAQVRRFVAERA